MSITILVAAVFGAEALVRRLCWRQTEARKKKGEHFRMADFRLQIEPRSKSAI
jgi:hypothetical protein